MKYLFIILIFCFHNSNAQTKDTLWIAPSNDYVVKNGGIYGNAGIQRHQPIDSVKIYWKKVLFYKNKLLIEELRHPIITKDLFRFDDSVTKYKTLLEKYKSK